MKRRTLLIALVLTITGCADSWESQPGSDSRGFEIRLLPAEPVTRANRSLAASQLESRDWIALDRQHAAQLTGLDPATDRRAVDQTYVPYLVRGVYIAGTEGQGEFNVFANPDTHDLTVEYVAHSQAWEERWPLVVELPTPPRQVIVRVERAIPWGGKIPSAILPKN